MQRWIAALPHEPQACLTLVRDTLGVLIIFGALLLILKHTLS